MDALALAAANAATFWVRVAAARGYSVRRGEAFVAVEGDERYGLRVLILSPTLPPGDLDALAALAERPGRVVIEDAFGAVTFPAAAMSVRHLPVMIRYPHEPVDAPSIPVRRVETAAQLRVAERLVVDGFALEHFQPWEPGVVFPDALLGPVELFVADLDGEPAGACVAVPEDDAVGVYWVTTMPAFRSRGMGRALMHELLRRYDDRPVTLTASRLGRPLYESLGFERLADASWWTPAQA
ncbi:MAG TPA: GNAT family N-acetyltransferase [Dactylosporangium sp.]|jgi:GNAT superfamily N-acetyltransferase|nr:GNAT family N-acetyltransferase [Dactylosporangium sp.]